MAQWEQEFLRTFGTFNFWTEEPFNSWLPSFFTLFTEMFSLVKGISERVGHSWILKLRYSCPLPNHTSHASTATGHSLFPCLRHGGVRPIPFVTAQCLLDYMAWNILELLPQSNHLLAFCSSLLFLLSSGSAQKAPNYILGKLHFTTLTYAPDYTLHSKLFKCTICAVNFDYCYTLHLDVNFIIKLDENIKHVICTCILLKWHKLKRPKPPSSQSIKNNFFFSLSCVSTPLPKPKSFATLNPQIKNHIR